MRPLRWSAWNSARECLISTARNPASGQRSPGCPCVALDFDTDALDCVVNALAIGYVENWQRALSELTRDRASYKVFNTQPRTLFMVPISRRELFVVGASAALGGCTAVPSDGSEQTTGEDANQTRTETPGNDASRASIEARFDCASAARPTPDVESGVVHEVESEDGETVRYESVGSTEYPDPPAALNEEPVETFLREYEVAYRRNYLADVYGEGLVEFSIEYDDVTRATRNERIELYVLAYEEVFRAFDPASPEGSMVSGHDPTRVAYAIDETGLVRRDRLGLDDPTGEEVLGEGNIVACF